MPKSALSSSPVKDPTSGVSPEEAVSEVRDVLDSLGDTCPECLPA
jgi:hypothetical protein